MKIVLTGMTGFIGQNLMPQLRALGLDYDFLVLNNHVEKALQMFPAELYPNFRQVHVSDLNEVVTFNPEVVLHLAALVSSANDTEIIHPMLSANIEFGVLLLDTLQRCDNFKLFVNTGSFAEFRSGMETIDNAYLYSATKTAFRSFLAYYSNLGKGFKYITTVPYSVYGGQMTVKRIFDYLAECTISEQPIDMTAGEQILDFVHVDDVAAFYTYVITHMDEFLRIKDNGRNYYLGTGIGTSIRQVAKMIEVITGKQCNVNWGGRPYRERDVMRAVAPVNLNQCGWKATIKLEDGVKRFLQVWNKTHNR